MADEYSLGFFGDVVAQHLYQDGVPIGQYRRWSLDGGAWQLLPDPDPTLDLLHLELADASDEESGLLPAITVADSVCVSVDGATASWQAWSALETLVVAPETDDTADLGTATERWRTVYCAEAACGDLTFTDEACPLCGKGFELPQFVVLQALGYRPLGDARRATRTVPVHLVCALRELGVAL